MTRKKEEENSDEYNRCYVRTYIPPDKKHQENCNN